MNRKKKKKKFFKKSSQLIKDKLLNATNPVLISSKAKKTIAANNAKNSPQSKFAKLKNSSKERLLILSIVLLSGFMLIYYFYFTSNKTNFSIQVNNFNSVEFKETYRNDNPTSPLCGCLNDSVPHDGIMIPSKYCRVFPVHNKQEKTNFLITNPDESVLAPVACFSFDTEIYSSSDPKSREMSISELVSNVKSAKVVSLENTDSTHVFREYKNNGFLSIISEKDIEIYSEDSETITAFIGSVTGITKVTKVFNKYEGLIDRLEINNYNALTDLDSINKMPSVDIHSKKIYIKWTDTLEVLTPTGSSRKHDNQMGLFSEYFKKKILKPAQSIITVNVAVIKPKNNLRISILPWNDIYYKQWQRRYLKQFPEPENYYYYLDVPFLNRKTKEEVTFKNIKPFATPTFADYKSNVNVEFKYFMSDSIYNLTYNKFIKENGYYYQYDSNDYEFISKVDITNAIVDTNFERRLSYRDSLNTTNAELLIEQQKELLKSVDMSKAKTTNDDTVMLNGRQEYFRFPPLHKEKGISFYNKFSFLKFFKCNGLIQIGTQKITLNNQTIELSNLQNIDYEYPSLFTTFDEIYDGFTIKGNGEINIDGNTIKESFFEKRNIIILSTIATLIGLIITLLQLIFKKRTV